MNLIDSHCHLENDSFEEDEAQVVANMLSADVTRCILAGSDMETSAQIVSLTKQYPFVYGVVGIHPHEAKTFVDADIDTLAKWLQEPNIVGVGEIGLDYFYDLSPREMQKEVLLKQLLFAKEKDVPVSFHVRDAHGDMIDLLRAHRSQLPKGTLHCFSGSVESARQYLDMGFYLSFAGPVTFNKAHNLQEAAVYCPLDRLLVETDSPYLAPVPKRGKRNEPANVRIVAQKIADLRGISLEALAEATTQNTCRLFGLPTEGK